MAGYQQQDWQRKKTAAQPDQALPKSEASRPQTALHGGVGVSDPPLPVGDGVMRVRIGVRVRLGVGVRLGQGVRVGVGVRVGRRVGVGV